MVRIAPIKLQYNPKTLWFDPDGLDIKQGDAVVVNTMRGIEFGHATKDVFEAEEADVKKLKSELKKVKRIATPQDEERALEMEKRSQEALPVFKEMAAEASKDMRPVSVEFLLDGDKAVFYFEAEERVDFRDLVRKLAAHFHVRIDMRQIGVRDEARIIGGLGHCGQELCCKRLGGEFNPVSIRMAKEQDLSLNPQKISGVCGRLMCCLRYEFDAYKDFKDRAPKMNAKIETPEGIAKVIDLNVPKEIITLLLDDDKKVKIPLNEMESANPGERPTKVNKLAFEQFANQNILDTFDSVIFSQSSSDSSSGAQSKGDQKRSSKGAKKGKTEESARKPRRRTKVAKDASSEEAAAEKTSKPSKRSRNQRSKKQNQPGDTSQQAKRNNDKPRNQGKKQGPERSQSSSGPRPGQRSSGLRKEGEKPQQSKPKNASSANQQPAREGGERRKTRRRSHKANADSSGGSNES
ncbi:MAG: regulatory iron-sulfur-containing complex subunit RicT [Raoultibacter sp.]|jgi:cell fate regulator YaaT (PSP1 superfamily)